MANEFAINVEDMVAVAYAIREKNGTNDIIVFPDGFVSAIQNIKAGGGLNFEIVGSTEQPANPSENTVWIETDREITEWIFSVEEPENKTEGMLWISLGTKSSVSFNALSEGNIQVYPSNAQQYVSGAWVSKTARTYKNGEWKGWVFYLYRKGEGLEENFVSVMAVTITDTAITATGHAAVRTAEMVDFDAIASEKLVARVYMGSKVYDYPLNLVVTDTIASGNNFNPPAPANPPDAAIAYSKISNPTANAENVIELNVKNISGKHYVGLGLGYHNGSEVLEIRFE